MQRSMRFAPYVAFVLSGLSSLIFQTIWTRMLHHVFGATSVAISTVLTVFMAGLGLGTWISGRVADRIRHPLFTYALAELGVALWGLLVPFLVASDGWLAEVNAFLRQSLGAESTMFMIARFFCVVPILLVPTTLMGTSLPLLSQHFARQEKDPERASARVGTLYAVNTFGAALGPFLSAFVLMPVIGLWWTNVFACSLNLSLAGLVFALRGPLTGTRWGDGTKLGFLPEKEPVVPSNGSDMAGGASTPRARKPNEHAAELRRSTLREGLLGTGFAIGGPVLAAATGANAWLALVLVAGALWVRAISASLEARELVRRANDKAGEAHAPTVEDAPFVSKAARIMGFVAFAASGASALCYEVVWSRALAMTIGSSIYSFAIILDTFLIGIAIGAAAMSAIMGDARSRVSGIALTAALLTVLAMTPWAIEMRLGGDRLHNGDIVNWLLVSFFPLAIIAMLELHARATRLRAVHAKDARAAGRDLWTGHGLVMLLVPTTCAVLNVAYFPVGYLPKILASVVVAVAVFLAVAIALRRHPVLLLALIQLFIAAATTVSYVWQDEVPYAFAQLVVSIDDLPSHVGSVQFFMFLTAALVSLPATLGMGAMFPLTMRIWTAGGDRIARDVSVVYTGNTVGSIVGSWLPGFVLLPWIGLERTLHVGIVLNLVLALAMLIAGAADPEEPKKSGRADREAPARKEELPAWHAVLVYVLSPAIPALMALLYLGTAHTDSLLRWNLTQMTLGVFRVSLAEGMLDPESWGQPDLVYYHDGISTTVSVERWGRHYALKNNGKVDASNGDDMPTQITVGAYPMLLHPRGTEPLDLAVVGFGSGVTVGTALSFPVRSVDVIELERSIPEAARFFQDVNLLEYRRESFPFVQMDRLEIVNDDGRNYLASTDRRYDVIISEPSNPWITGVSDLFTVDHFAITKRRLREGGVYCQWVQLYEMSPENIKTIYRTFASQFEHVMVLAADDRSSDTVMLGSDSPLTLDLGRMRNVFDLPQVAERMSVRDQLDRAGLHSPFDVFARVLLATREEVLDYSQIERRERGGTWEYQYGSTNQTACHAPLCVREAVALNTDDNARIEFAAPRDLIGFERYEGYLATIYSSDWPYGDLDAVISGMGEGDERARNEAELAMSLLGHGRYELAANHIEAAQAAGHARETAVALEVLTHLISGENEPSMRIEAPVPGPEMDRASSETLARGFERVRVAIDRGQWSSALSAMENIPAPLRNHSGPALRALYGYLIWKAADGATAQYRAAAEQLDDLVRTEPEYVVAHPEVLYFLARSRDAEGEYDEALRNMRLYVEARLVVSPRDAAELAEPNESEAPITDVPGEADKTTPDTET